MSSNAHEGILERMAEAVVQFDEEHVDAICAEALTGEQFGKRLTLIGSVPTVTHLLEGSREDVVRISRDMINRGTDMLSPSCGLPQYTSLENVRAVAELASACQELLGFNALNVPFDMTVEAEALGCELCGLCSVNEIDIHL